MHDVGRLEAPWFDNRFRGRDKVRSSPLPALTSVHEPAVQTIKACALKCACWLQNKVNWFMILHFTGFKCAQSSSSHSCSCHTTCMC